MSKSFNKLVHLMKILRSEKGCPWDRAQTHSSMKRHLIEEAYEVCEAMDSKTPEKFKEELGDLLFQVIFHAEIARQRGAFDINDILRHTYKKMLRRHPHVFGRRKANSPEEAYRRWQEKKDEENNYEKKDFNLSHIDEVIKKAETELDHIKKALKNKDKNKLHSKIWDFLFALANLAQFKTP